jgi:hypothetical protein
MRTTSEEQRYVNSFPIKRLAVAILSFEFLAYQELESPRDRREFSQMNNMNII